MKVVGHKNQNFRMIVKGKSMEPTIMEDSNVTIEPAHPAHVRIGDVVVFKVGNKMIVHRVIGIHKIKEDIFFVEKGDNSLISSIFPYESLVGRICGLENKNVVNLYNKNFVINYLLVTYPLFKKFQIMRQLLSKKNKKLAEFIFNFYLVPLRFLGILSSIIL